jgi:hypothetical protein
VWPVAQVVSDLPSNFTRPSKLRFRRQASGRVAKLDDLIQKPEVLVKDDCLFIGISYVSVGVRDQEDFPGSIQQSHYRVPINLDATRGWMRQLRSDSMQSQAERFG